MCNNMKGFECVSDYLLLGQLKIIFSFSSPPAPEKLAARNNFFIIIKSELVGSSRKPNIGGHIVSTCLSLSFKYETLDCDYFLRRQNV